MCWLRELGRKVEGRAQPRVCLDTGAQLRLEDLVPLPHHKGFVGYE